MPRLCRSRRSPQPPILLHGPARSRSHALYAAAAALHGLSSSTSLPTANLQQFMPFLAISLYPTKLSRRNVPSHWSGALSSAGGHANTSGIRVGIMRLFVSLSLPKSRAKHVVFYISTLLISQYAKYVYI